MSEAENLLYEAALRVAYEWCELARIGAKKATNVRPNVREGRHTAEGIRGRHAVEAEYSPRRAWHSPQGSRSGCHAEVPRPEPQ